MTDRILALAAEAASHAVTFRRDFHKHPELGFTEFRTASLVARRCTELGLSVKIGKEAMQADARLGLPSEAELEEAYQRAEATGADPEFLPLTRGGFTAVVAELVTGRPGPTVAMRFDMDALPILESDSTTHLPTREGFRSTFEGLMHSCGHDSHTAMGLGVAEVLASMKDELNGTYRLLFQPAEEGCRGAYAMTEAGMLDGVDYLVSGHIGIGAKSGHIYTKVGGFLASTKLDITLKGAPSHAGGNPEDGKNALLGAAQVIQGLYGISRHSRGDSRVNVGVLHGGTGRNIIPDSAYMMVEVRGSTDEVEAFMQRRARQIVEGAAVAYELEADIQVTGRGLNMTCDDDLATLVAEASQGIPGLQVHDELFMSGGSEDISIMARRVQDQGGKITFMAIGSNSPTGHHTTTFDLVEKDLFGAIATYTLTCARLSQKG